MTVQLEQFTNGLSFNLGSAISAGTATLTPPSYIGWPATGQFRLKIDTELILVTDASTHPWPITRGIESTTAASHVLGALAIQQLTAGALQHLVGVSQSGTLEAIGQTIDFTGSATVTQPSDGLIRVAIGTGSGEDTATDFKATGLTGATAIGRFVGATTSGAPVSGTFAVGDFIIAQDGKVWICTVAGTPGTWSVVGTPGMSNPMTTTGDMIQGGGSGSPARLAIGTAGQVLQVVGGVPTWGAPPASFSSEVSAPDFKATGLTGATQASRWVGATTSGAPISGTFAKGDAVLDQTSSVWLCTTAGTPGTWKQIVGNPTFTAEVSVPDLKVTGLTGAATVSRWVGSTAGGAPGSGTFALGDAIIDNTGSVWICTTGGTPGTWAQIAGSSGTFAGEVQGTDFKATGLTGAVAASRYVGAVASGHPASGTFLKGDYTVDQSGSFWVCTVAGTPGTWNNVAGGITNPMTTTGDLIAGGSSGTPQRLAVGSAGQVLGIVSAQPAWVSTVAVNPMTAEGDLIRGGMAGAQTRLAVGAAGQRLKSDGTDPGWGDDIVDVNFVIDGGGVVLTTGIKGYVQINQALTIVANTLLADQSGSVVVDVFKCTYAQFDAGSTHPVTGDKITASAPPTISSATKATDSTLTGWTTAISAGDILAFNVTSVTTCQRVSCILKCKKAA